MKNTPWRLAHSLRVLLEQLDKLHPDRSKEHDGSIGDALHARRNSDHNPWVKLKQGNVIMGVVTAIDITHDIAGGVDCHALSEILKLDSRVKYIIWNARIYNPSIAMKWRRYKGVNLHRSHMHVSVMPQAKFFDASAAWLLR